MAIKVRSPILDRIVGQWFRNGRIWSRSCG